MQTVNFSDNHHGKLFPDFFQDLRLPDEEKYMPGNVHEIQLKGNVLGTAKVMAIRPCRYCNISDTFSFMNLGRHAAYQASMLERFYVHRVTKFDADTRLVQVVWRWETRNHELFDFLLTEWWNKTKASTPNL